MTKLSLFGLTITTKKSLKKQKTKSAEQTQRNLEQDQIIKKYELGFQKYQNIIQQKENDEIEQTIRYSRLEQKCHSLEQKLIDEKNKLAVVGKNCVENISENLSLHDLVDWLENGDRPNSRNSSFSSAYQSCSSSSYSSSSDEKE